MIGLLKAPEKWPRERDSIELRTRQRVALRPCGGGRPVDNGDKIGKVSHPTKFPLNPGRPGFARSSVQDAGSLQARRHVPAAAPLRLTAEHGAGDVR
jgi:hypothetical protein